MDQFFEEELAEINKPIKYALDPKKVEKSKKWVEKIPLEANSADELVAVLGLSLSPPDLLTAGLMAYVARNPGQSVKLPIEWHNRLRELGATYSDEQWAEAARVGVLIASHKFVKTPRPKKEKA